MQDNLDDYPFSAHFLSTAQVIKPSEDDREEAKASLKSLASLLPEDVIPEENPDLIYFAANGAVAGVCNENDDCLDPATALEIYHLSKNKYLNVDHKRDIVVGSVLYPGLSSYGENQLITEEEAATKPYFNLSVVAIMWRAINKKLAELLEKAGDEDNSDFGKVSLSWEVFFKGYDIAIGSPILSEARIVTDPEERKKLEPYLKRNKGSGEYQGQRVYRVIRNTDVSKNVIIGGYSLVLNPAAQVTGILNLLSNPSKKLEVDKSEAQTTLLTEKNEENQEKDKNLSISDSQLQKSFVNPNIAQTDTVTQKSPTLSIKQFMDIKKVEDITSNWGEFSKLEESVASTKISEVWKNGIKEASEKFVADIEAKDKALAEAQANIAKALAEVESLKASHAEATKQLDEIQASQKAAQDQEIYSGRVAQIESEYDLEDEDRQALASEILGMDDESFAGYMKRFASLAKYKSKKFKDEMKAKMKEELKKEMEAKASAETSTASTKTAEEIAEEALAAAEAEKVRLSAHVETEKNVFETYANAFSKEKVRLSA